jgi:hypothetical protein
VFVLVSISRSACFGGELVTDEAMRLRVIHLAFPTGRISTLPPQPSGDAFPIEDPLNRVVARLKNALEQGPDYQAIGPVAKNEKNPASDVTDFDRPASNKRQVQMRLYRWKANNGEPLLVAVLRYSFPNANPPRCCRVIGKVLLLSSTADRILDVLDKVPYAFTIFTEIRFIPQAGTAPELLIIGADYSGVSSVGVSSVILDASDGHLKPLMSISTMVLYEAELENADVHTLSLDEQRTLVAGGRRFFFVKKSYVEKGKVRRTPVTTNVSFPVGTGLPLDWLEP